MHPLTVYLYGERIAFVERERVLSEHLGNLRVMFPLSSESVAEVRRKRWRLQTVAAELLPNQRVAKCYRTPSGGGKIEIWCNEHSNQAYYRNLITCGSVWTCPICSAKITEERRSELHDAVIGWSGELVMVTLTLQHSRDDDLEELLEAVKDAWRRLKSGRWWLKMRKRYGLQAYVSSTEVTHGNANGWHPHIHALFFVDIDGEFDVDGFKIELNNKYLKQLERHGRYASEYYGIDVRLGSEHVGDYLSKYGSSYELTKSISKNGKNGGASPFQLLERCMDGDEYAGALFKEYARVFFGKRQLNWSHGARDLLGIGEELDDEEIAAQEDEDESVLMASIDYQDYKKILAADIRGEVLEIASRGDANNLWRYLKHSVGISPPIGEDYSAWMSMPKSEMERV